MIRSIRRRIRLAAAARSVWAGGAETVGLRARVAETVGTGRRRRRWRVRRWRGRRAHRRHGHCRRRGAGAGAAWDHPAFPGRASAARARTARRALRSVRRTAPLRRACASRRSSIGQSGMVGTWVGSDTAFMNAPFQVVDSFWRRRSLFGSLRAGELLGPSVFVTARTRPARKTYALTNLYSNGMSIGTLVDFLRARRHAAGRDREPHALGRREPSPTSSSEDLGRSLRSVRIRSAARDAWARAYLHATRERSALHTVEHRLTALAKCGRRVYDPTMASKKPAPEGPSRFPTHLSPAPT